MGVGEQMLQIREEICSWVALGKLVGVLAEGRREKAFEERWRGKGLFHFLLCLVNKDLYCLRVLVNCSSLISKGKGGVEVGQMESPEFNGLK